MKVYIRMKQICLLKYFQLDMVDFLASFKKKKKKIAHFHVHCSFAAVSYSKSGFFSSIEELSGFILKLVELLGALCNENLIYRHLLYC